MKKLTQAVVLFVGAIIATQSLQAQDPPFVANDLYLGFENSGGGGSADYLVNLGSLSALDSFGPSANLNGYLSEADLTSASLMGTNSGATLMAGVVGGSSAQNPSSLFVTELRNGAGNAALPGSSSPGSAGVNEDTIAASDLSELSTPAVGSGLLDSGRTWESQVEPTFAAGSLWGDTGINPDSLVGSGVLYEDLWGTSSSGGVKSFVYEGYFALDIAGVTPTLTFNPVPEPSSYLLSGVGGILVLLLRFRLSRRNA